MQHRFSVLILVLLLGLTLAIFGCGGGGGSNDNSSSPLTSVPVGSFGGMNIGLAVTAAGGTITLPCGSTGTITPPLPLDATGHFSAAGTITPASNGGVQPVGSGPKPYAAQFTGTTDGKTLNLTITPNTSTGLSAATYTLTYGATPTFTALCPQ